MNESKLTLYRNFCMVIASIVTVLWIWWQLPLERFEKGFLLGVLLTSFAFGLVAVSLLSSNSTRESSPRICVTEDNTGLLANSTQLNNHAESSIEFDYTTRRLIKEGEN